LQLLPNVGPVGTKVLVVGVDYRPGSRVNIVYGSPNASFMPQPLGSGVIPPNGTFRTTFTVSCGFVVLHTRQAMHPPKRCPLSSSAPFRAVVIGAFIDHRFVYKRTEVMGFIVTGYSIASVRRATACARWSAAKTRMSILPMCEQDSGGGNIKNSVNSHRHMGSHACSKPFTALLSTTIDVYL
jgi:hypothetical protein